MRVRREQRHLTLRVTTIRAMRVALDELADGKAIGRFAGRDGGVPAHLPFVRRRPTIVTVATARCIATSDTLVPTDAIVDIGPPRDNTPKMIAMTVQIARALVVK